MYLSKLLLDPANRQVQSEIANRYELHRTLTKQFPETNRADIGLLFRIEIPDQHSYQPIILLVQSQVKPSWQGLLESGLLTEPASIKEYDISASAGENYYFRLQANPTIRKKQSEGHSKRVGLYTAEDQKAWLERKAESGGFLIRTAKIHDLGLIRSTKLKGDRKHPIQHLGIQFEGVLKVTDADIFFQTIKNGIGSAKAFGFGLLSLAR